LHNENPNTPPRLLTVDNAGNTGTTPLGDNDLHSDVGLLVSGGATVLLHPGQILNSLHIAPTGRMTAPYGPLQLHVHTDATIDAGGAIYGDGKGYPPGSSAPGSGAHSPDYGGGGGGYGGPGGTGQIDTPGGAAYGSRIHPTEPGSCGGNGWQSEGGAGGGPLDLSVDGTLTVNGIISADGLPGTGDGYGGGGAGGSIWIKTEILTGSGTIHANGGSGATYGGGGGGGRIAFDYADNAFTGTAVALGGEGYTPGQAGSVYWPGDVNGDRSVDVFDLLLMAGSFGTSAAQNGFDVRCDLTDDGVINIFDLLILAERWGPA
jgi:hypothetical protein